MSVLSTFENYFQFVEADVLKFFTAGRNDLAAVVAGVAKVMTWIAAHQSQIDGDLQTALAIASASGVPMTPELAAAVKLVDIGAAAVDSVAATVKANPGASNAAIVFNGVGGAYQAVKSAQQAVSAAQASVAGAATAAAA